MTMVKGESDEILSQVKHCIQKKWTMRLKRANKEEVIMGVVRIKITISTSWILKYKATRIVVYQYGSSGGPITNQPRRKMAWLYSSLTDELETRWRATELQLGGFIATRNKISAIDRQLDQTSKV